MSRRVNTRPVRVKLEVSAAQVGSTSGVGGGSGDIIGIPHWKPEGETEMRRELTFALCVFAFLVALECPVLPAQTEDAKPASKTSGLSNQGCDSLKNPAPGESLTDAANRHRAWWHCLEKGEGAGTRLSDGMSPPAIMDNRRLVAGVVPSFVDSQSPPVTRIGIDVRSSSPNSQPETFTVRIGQWSKVISANQILRGSHRFLSTLGLTRKTPPLPIQ